MLVTSLLSSSWTLAQTQTYPTPEVVHHSSGSPAPVVFTLRADGGALHLTSGRKRPTLLLNAGCDPSVKDIHGNLAAHYAAGNGYRGILEAIERAGGDIELLDGSGRTAVEWAREKGEMEVVRILNRKMMVRGRGGRG